MTNTEIIDKLIHENRLMDAGQAALYLKDGNTYKVREAIEHTKVTPELFELYENLLLADACDDFDCFCRYVDFNAQTAVRQFYLPRRHYLKPVAEALMRVEQGETEVLRVAMVTRSGKSELAVSRFLAWYAGRHPDSQNLGCVGGARLANSLFKKTKTMWGEFSKAYLNVFPDMTISKMSNEDRILWINRESEYGNITIVSIDQNYEGFCECTGILLIDDIVTAEVANNKLLLAKQYEDDVLNRLMGRRISGQIVLIGTPQHPQDALQRLYSDMSSTGIICETIAVPALNERGESNYEYEKATLRGNKVVYKKEYTTEVFQKELKVAQNSNSPVAMANWNTRRMMNPMTAEGLVLPEVKYWDELPERFEREFCIIDTKTKGSDSFVGFLVKVASGMGYVTSIFFDSGEMIGMTKRLVDWIVKNSIMSIDVETNAAGALYSLNIKDEIKARGILCRVEEHFTSRNKHDRIMASVETVANDMLFDKSQKGQYAMAIEQMQSYTADGRAIHDDVFDCASLASEKLKQQQKRPTVIMTGRIF